MFVSGFANLTATSFDGNRAQSDGGAVAVLAPGPGLFTGVSLTNNAAGASGGGWFAGPGAAVVASGVTAVNNTAAKDGGAACANANLTITAGSLFSQNVCGGAGGAAFAGISTALVISDSAFVGNRAYQAAGAVYAKGNLTSLLRANLTGNVCSGPFAYAGGLAVVPDRGGCARTATTRRFGLMKETAVRCVSLELLSSQWVVLCCVARVDHMPGESRSFVPFNHLSAQGSHHLAEQLHGK